jgi:hypothetical protein
MDQEEQQGKQAGGRVYRRANGTLRAKDGPCRSHCAKYFTLLW